jgi:hypothetical protein
MRVQVLAGVAALALVLAGCGGGDQEPPAAPDTETTVDAGPTAAGEEPQASGTVDCANLTEEDVATVAVWSQLFAQVRTPDAMEGMEALGYDPAQMEAYLDELDGLKGTEGEVYGTPDEALVVFRTANDTYAAIIAKGDAATEADFASLNEAYPDAQAWIQAQATIFDALNQACPELGS